MSGKRNSNELNLCSPDFNPLKALYRPERVQIPCSTAPTYDNISVFIETPDGIFPRPRRNPVGKLENKTKQLQIANDIPQASTSTESKKETNQEKKNQKNVITRMENVKGPLSFIKKCMTEKLRVKVCTRSAVTIRGFCFGFIEAFDKHWNLVLKDVFETWWRKRKKKSPYLGGPVMENKDDLSGDLKDKSQKRLDKGTATIDKPRIFIRQQFKRKELCERHVDQLLIRGEQIVYITLAN